MLNGANAALVETDAGCEMLQFAGAETVSADTYRLLRLLRGQQESEPEMLVGAAEGARNVFLTGAETRLEVADWETGLALAWRAWRQRPDEPAAWSGESIHAARAARMWSPAQLQASWSGGGRHRTVVDSSGAAGR